MSVAREGETGGKGKGRHGKGEKRKKKKRKKAFLRKCGKNAQALRKGRKEMTGKTKSTAGYSGKEENGKGSKSTAEENLKKSRHAPTAQTKERKGRTDKAATARKLKTPRRERNGIKRKEQNPSGITGTPFLVIKRKTRRRREEKREKTCMGSKEDVCTYTRTLREAVSPRMP